MNRKLKYIFYVVLATLVVSCNNWLDVKPRGEVERKEFYESEKGFEAALIGCYVKMKGQNMYGKEMTMTTLEYMAQHWIPVSGGHAVRNFSYKETESLYSKIYAAFYNVIAQTNDILNHLETNGDVFSSESKRDLIKGEALAIRAFCHFDMLRLFGQMPSGTGKSVSLPYSRQTGNKPVPTYSYNDFKAKVLEDYKAAAELLKKNDPIMRVSFDRLNDPYKLITQDKAIDNDFWAYRRVRMNYFGVKALMARTYLYFGDKTNAYQCASEVIQAKYDDGSDVISLDKASSDFQEGRYTLPSETLLALNIYNISDYADPLFRSREVISASDNNTVIARDIFDNQKDIDIRGQLWYEELSDVNAKKNTIKKYWQVKALNDNNDNDSYGSMENKQMVPLIRLSEVYLIAIETSSDMTISNTLFKNFKRTRGLPYIDFTDRISLMSEVVKEYRKEFYAEGQMFFTYKRLGTEFLLWRDDKKMTDEEYVVPLPTSEIK